MQQILSLSGCPACVSGRNPFWCLAGVLMLVGYKIGNDLLYVGGSLVISDHVDCTGMCIKTVMSQHFPSKTEEKKLIDSQLFPRICHNQEVYQFLKKFCVYSYSLGLIFDTDINIYIGLVRT